MIPQIKRKPLSTMNSLRTLLGVGVHFLPKAALVTIGRFKIRDLRYPHFPSVQYGGRAAQNQSVARAFAATRNRNRYF